MKYLLRPAKREQLLELLSICVELDSAEQIESLLGDICTTHELIALSERWTIAKLLHMGFSYRTITKKTGASAATISRMAKLLMHGSGGLRDACLRRQQSFIVDRSDMSTYRLLHRPFHASIS